MWNGHAALRVAAQVVLLCCRPLPVPAVQLANKAQGEVCNPDLSQCAAGLACTCLALNRGLWVCEPEGFLDPPDYAKKYERQGLSCEPKLPKGAKPVPRPPLVSSSALLDPRSSDSEELQEWSKSTGHGFYSQYILVAHPQDHLLGLPLLAGPDVSPDYIKKSAETVRHVLFDAAVSKTTAANLAHTGIKFLIAAEEDEDKDTWLVHPEVSRSFTTGLGGASPLFPSIGVHDGEAQDAVVEELFHTIQYCSLSPRAVCMYRKAYKNAMELQLYETDDSGREVDGEPVPTVQADEYLAMALQRWFGSHVGTDEYHVPGNDVHRSGRSSLQKKDPMAFCILTTIFRANDTWDPASDEPWASFPNKANRVMQMGDVEDFCHPVLEDLGSGCPSQSVTWPTAQPRLIP